MFDMGDVEVYGPNGKKGVIHQIFCYLDAILNPQRLCF